ncbi:MAG: tripartite tricarboxylate transporter TctB family protein [Synergistaceae bacterium]|nr:tripartite tricarboxylate transporter TctB family protein [Synergistaceae bacterium]
MKKIHIDVWLGIIFIALSVYFYMLTDEFFDMEAAKWPRGVLIVTGTLSAMLFAHGIIETKNNIDSGVKLLTAPVIATIIIAAYAAAMEYTDYFISTAVFVPLGMFLQGQKNWKIIIGVTAGLEIFVYLLFVVGLKLRMP